MTRTENEDNVQDHVQQNASGSGQSDSERETNETSNNKRSRAFQRDPKSQKKKKRRHLPKSQNPRQILTTSLPRHSRATRLERLLPVQQPEIVRDNVSAELNHILNKV